MGLNIKGALAAVGLSFMTACGTTPTTIDNEASFPQQESAENSLLGKKNPETGCFEKTMTREDGTSFTDINCPFIKDL